jgi:hypothetical protein
MIFGPFVMITWLVVAIVIAIAFPDLYGDVADHSEPVATGQPTEHPSAVPGPAGSPDLGLNVGAPK